MSESIGEYTLDSTLSALDIERFEAGSNVLLIGPGGDALRDVAMRFITPASSNDQGALIIATDGGLDAYIDAFQSEGGDDTSVLSFIDCTGGEDLPETLESAQISSIKSPSSLTELGMSFVQYEDEHGSRRNGTRVLFDTLSDLIESLGEERVFEFTDAFIGRIQASQHLGIWLIDTDRNSEQTVSTFMELFDTTIEFREDDGEWSLRCIDSTGEDPPWVTIDDDQ